MYIYIYIIIKNTIIIINKTIIIVEVMHWRADWPNGLSSCLVMATVVMCRVRNPACTATSALGKERYING